MTEQIPFNRPYLTGHEIEYIQDAHQRGQLAGDGFYTKKCSDWLSNKTGASTALLTHSCTAALEMAAILINIEPGDEVIMPSYTFVSTANAFVLRGAVPVFVDIRVDTLNIDETLIEKSITKRTKAIVVVHYAGVPCEMMAILSVAKKYNLFVIEDAAQALMSEYEGRPAGGLGDLGCFSFHETKNLIAGEGGALIVNNPKLAERAEIIREKGTNRSRFFRGQVDKYTWCDIGSSYLPGELIAAFLWAQLQSADEITQRRKVVWDLYHDSLSCIESSKLIRVPTLPNNIKHNAHLYYLIICDLVTRTELISFLKEKEIHAVFHYVPLHSSPMGRYCKISNQLTNTEYLSDRIVRLPLWLGQMNQLRIISEVKKFLLGSE